MIDTTVALSSRHALDTPDLPAHQADRTIHKVEHLASLSALILPIVALAASALPPPGVPP